MIPVIQMHQASWYQLVFPIQTAGQPIASIVDAKLVLYRNSTTETTLQLNQGLSFADSKITAILDETVTRNLVNRYSYELWIVDFQNNPVFVRSGQMDFTPTKTRF